MKGCTGQPNYGLAGELMVRNKNEYYQEKKKATKMKAIVYTKSGPPEVLQLREIEKPTLKDDEVLIRVYAASVNSPDSRGTSKTNKPDPRC